MSCISNTCKYFNCLKICFETEQSAEGEYLVGKQEEASLISSTSVSNEEGINKINGESSIQTQSLIKDKKINRNKKTLNISSELEAAKRIKKIYADDLRALQLSLKRLQEILSILNELTRQSETMLGDVQKCLDDTHGAHALICDVEVAQDELERGFFAKLCSKKGKTKVILIRSNRHKTWLTMVNAWFTMHLPWTWSIMFLR